MADWHSTTQSTAEAACGGAFEHLPRLLGRPSQVWCIHRSIRLDVHPQKEPDYSNCLRQLEGLARAHVLIRRTLILTRTVLVRSARPWTGLIRTRK